MTYKTSDRKGHNLNSYWYGPHLKTTVTFMGPIKKRRLRLLTRFKNDGCAYGPSRDDMPQHAVTMPLGVGGYVTGDGTPVGL